jgi:hypothetical protein
MLVLVVGGVSGLSELESSQVVDDESERSWRKPGGGQDKTRFTIGRCWICRAHKGPLMVPHTADS